MYVVSSHFWICLIFIQIILIFYRRDISRISFGICFQVLFSFESGELDNFSYAWEILKIFDLLIWIGSCFLIIYMLIIILVMISMINCWIWIIDMNQYIYSELTSELVAPHLIDVMSWALRYEYVCLIMIMNLWYVSQNTMLTG